MDQLRSLNQEGLVAKAKKEEEAKVAATDVDAISETAAG
jgi:hypothetical protein